MRVQLTNINWAFETLNQVLPKELSVSVELNTQDEEFIGNCAMDVAERLTGAQIRDCNLRIEE